MTSNDIDREWAHLESHFRATRTAALAVIDLPSDAPQEFARARSLTTIVTHEVPFLAAMDRSVSLLEEQLTSRLRELRAYSVLIPAMILLLLLGIGGAARDADDPRPGRIA